MSAVHRAAVEDILGVVVPLGDTARTDGAMDDAQGGSAQEVQIFPLEILQAVIHKVKEQPYSMPVHCWCLSQECHITEDTRGYLRWC